MVDKIKPGDGVLPWAPHRHLPATRGDCLFGLRPCPWLRCRHHIWTAVSRKRSLPNHSCSLDVADEGAHTLDALGELLGLTRERMRQIEVEALLRAKARAPLVGVIWPVENDDG